MARTWLSIRVELVDGVHAPGLWPRPGRRLIARPGMTFRMLADAINDAFARWDRSHLHAFTLANGTRITVRSPWDEPDDALDDTEVTLTRLTLGEQFAFEFDFGDGWMHLCTVGDEKVDPEEVYGEVPDRPVPIWGWGWIPDQYGRRWDGDHGEAGVPAPPNPPLSDLPDLHHDWGRGAVGSRRPARFPVDGENDVAVAGPWTEAAGSIAEPWSYPSIQELRKSVGTRDVAGMVALLGRHDPLEVAHVVAPGLVCALQAGDPATRSLVTELLPRLTARGWLGDEELVGELERARSGAAGDLRPIPVDLDELASHLNGPDVLEESWVLDTATGTFVPPDEEGLEGLEEGVEEPEDRERLLVSGLGSRFGYGDMVDFIDVVDDASLADRLSDAIERRGAFRRFRDIVYRDEHWWGVWSTFSSERGLGRARWWLAEAGLRPATDADEIDGA